MLCLLVFGTFARIFYRKHRESFLFTTKFLGIVNQNIFHSLSVISFLKRNFMDGQIDYESFTKD